MLSRIAVAYFSRDEVLSIQSGVSSNLLVAWKEQWSGNLNASLDAYLRVDFASLDGESLAIAVADRNLISVKLGIPFEAPTIQPTSVAGLIITEYARFSWAFWVDHSIAWDALISLLKLGLKTLEKSVLITAIFLIGHLLAIRGNKLGYYLAKATHSICLRSLRRELGILTFFRHIVLAAFPYTLFVSGKLSQQVEKFVQLGEENLPSDPYYQTLFSVSALYTYAYSGNIARAELYSAKLSRQQEIGKLLRYRPVAQIMRLLPFAVRGYPHLIEDEFLMFLADHDNAKYDPLINSQFYRAAATIALFSGKNRFSLELIQIAIRERERAGSFNAWKHFDKRLESFASRPDPVKPSNVRLLGIPSEFESSSQLGSLLVELIQKVTPGIYSGNDWFTLQAAALIGQHLNGNGFEIYDASEIPNQLSSDPVIRIGNKYVLYKNVPVGRVRFFREMLSSFTPVIRSLVLNLDEQRKVKDISRAAAIGMIASQVAHDIRSPLSALTMLIKPSEYIPYEHKEILMIAVDRIDKIASDLLKPQVRINQAKIASCNLLKVLQDLIQEKDVIYSKQIVVCKHSLTTIAGTKVLADEVTLARVFSNVIDNGIEAMSNAHDKILQIKVSEVSTYGYATVFISDTGCGMGHEVIKKIGIRGFSFGKGLTGNGFGINFAKTYLASVGGNISFSSTVGKGTTVKIDIPIVAE